MQDGQALADLTLVKWNDMTPGVVYSMTEMDPGLALAGFAVLLVCIGGDHVQGCLIKYTVSFVSHAGPST